jgi:DNA-binding LacI/PurR family transcriptional regulator
MTSVREIAELAGVSKSTVSLVLNNKPGVSEAMRRQVLSAVDQLESRATTHAANPLSSTPSIVVLHPPVLRSSYVFSEVLRGIQSSAETYKLQLRLVSNDPDASAQHVARLYFSDATLRPDGVIVFGSKQHEPLLDAAQELGIPCVVLGRDAGKYAVSGIGRDEERIAYNATRYLLELGHKSIAFLGGEEQYDYVHNRVKGYRRALHEAGVKIAPHWIQSGHGGQATDIILRHVPEVTAIMYVNDSYAAEGLPMIHEAQLSIPDDLSVLSFDDTDIAQNHSPALTSVAYRRVEEGQWAVKMLLDQIHFPSIERAYTIFSAELRVRESCAAPRR